MTLRWWFDEKIGIYREKNRRERFGEKERQRTWVEGETEREHMIKVKERKEDI